MGKRFDLLVFDWDGTLIDSAAHIVTSLQSAAQDVGLPVPTDADARHIIGLGLQDAMTYLWPDLPSSDYRPLTERYRHHYLAGDHQVTLFPGALAAIPAWRAAGFQLAVATGKSRSGLDRSLQTTGLHPFFHASRCADESFSKPHPEMLLWLIETLGVDATRTVMIGDTTHDLQMAANAGVPAIAVAYGAHPRAKLEAHAPLACVGTFDELSEWLSRNA